MPKQSQIDKAIAALEAEKAVLQLAIDTLKGQLQKRAVKKSRKLAAVPPAESA